MIAYKVKWYIANDGDITFTTKEKLFVQEADAIAYKTRLQRAKQVLDIYTDIKIVEVVVNDTQGV